MRICSLLPAATEIVFALGLGDELYGVTYECDHPPGALVKPVVVRGLFEEGHYSSGEIDRTIAERLGKGESLYRLDVARLEEIEPDLIIAQGLCDVCAIGSQEVLKAVERLPKQPALLSLDPTCLGDVLANIQAVGEATGRRREAEELITTLRRRIEKVVSTAAKAQVRPRVLCLEWIDPPMVGGHWIPEMVEFCGGIDGLGNRWTPSTKIAWEAVQAYKPEVIVLMPCGFDVPRTLEEVPLLQKLEGWGRLPAVQRGRIYAVNGHAYFNRPGPRLVDGLEILACLIHPELFPGVLLEHQAVKIVHRDS